MRGCSLIGSTLHFMMKSIEIGLGKQKYRIRGEITCQKQKDY